MGVGGTCRSRPFAYEFSCFFFFVIPAQAGIHHRKVKFTWRVMDPRLRGGDE
jgi:hypothetical protein